MKKIGHLLFFICLYYAASAQRKVNISGKEEYIYPISIAEDTLASLQPLKDLFLSKQIVALGEATHGTREFTQLKISFLKFLITNCGYRSAIFEVPFGAMLFVDDYVTGGTGDIHIMLRNVGFWGLYTAEFRDFVNWTRNYNEDKSLEDKVHLWGMDMQTLLDPLFYLHEKSAGLPGYVKTGFDSIVEPFLQGRKQSEPISANRLTDSLKSQCTTLLARLQQWMKDHRQVIETTYSAQGADVWQLCLQNVDYAMRLSGNHLFFRDSCMAANVATLTGLTQQRSVVWAHNEHIGRHDSVVNYANLRNMMGEVLHHTFRHQYYPVGFQFESGSFLAMEEKTEKRRNIYPNFRVFYLAPDANNKLASDLSALSRSPFFIDLTNSSNPTWQRVHPFYTAGAIYRKKQSERLYRTPVLAFSALVFMPKTNAIVQLDDYFNVTVK